MIERIWKLRKQHGSLRVKLIKAKHIERWSFFSSSEILKDNNYGNVYIKSNTYLRGGRGQYIRLEIEVSLSY
jgi:hypothetical protein